MKVTGTLTVTGLCIAYIAWKIDLARTAQVVAHAKPAYLLGALAIFLGAVPPMAWRWQRLLAARDVDERLDWLIRAYFVSYAAGQVLPTSLGGDAARIFEGTRRHRGKGSAFAGSVLLERALGGAATLTLAAAGFGLALGRYEVGPYVWIEAFLVGAAFVGAIVIFSLPARKPLARLAPALRSLRIEKPVRSAYEGLHGYRRHTRLLLWMFSLTLGVQTFRIFAIWLAAKAVGVDLSPRAYFVMGPMLFLVNLVPFSLNGVAVREAFFVSFLGQLGVGPDAAFATGFLFFLLVILTSLPGAIWVAVDAISSPGQRRARSD